MPTINIGLKLGNTEAGSVTVSFEPRAQPVINGTELLIGPRVSATTNSSGAASITLAPGDYDVSFTGTSARCIISVPDDANTYDLTDLITSGTTYVSLNVLTGGASWTEQGSNPSTPAAGQWKLFFKPEGLYILDDAGTATLLAAGGEANTASNVGASGVSVFNQKTGVDLEFNKIAGATGISAALASNVITISASGVLADIVGASLATGDILYYDGANIVKLAIGSEDEVLTVSSGGIPEWAASGAGVTLPVADTTAIVKGSVDATKLVRIEADAITTGTTRVLTMPDSDVTLVANPVSESGSQTLTNKTISGASNTISNLPASAIASGTLVHEQGGLEADVSAYNGLVKISSGTTSAVTAPTGTVVGTSDTQTLTNKTISGASNTITNLSASNLSSGTVSRQRGGFGIDISGFTGIPSHNGFEWSFKTSPGGALVGTEATQTLTNKTISGSDNTITNLAASAIASGTVAHEQGGLEADVSAYDGILKITAGATSAVTAPSGTLVGTSDTQTLTNKTISGASNTISNLAASAIASGTLAHERGGLEADVSAYSGLVKIEAGATSAVTVTSFMESLLDDSSASAARSTLQVPGALDDLSDVSIVTPVTRNALFHNGSNWSNRAITTDDITVGSLQGLYLPEISAPSTPASGRVVIYPKTDNKLYAKNDAGTEYDLTAGAVRGGPISIITEATTSRTLALTDIGDYIRLTNASSCTITLPANATVDWASETYPPVIYFRVAAAGIPTLSHSITVNDDKGVIAALETGDTFALQWVASDVWDVI